MSCDCGKNKPSDKYDDWCSQYFTRVPLKGQYLFIFFIRIYSLVMLPLSSVLQLGEWGIKCYRNLPYECLPTLFIGSNVTLILIFHD